MAFELNTLNVDLLQNRANIALHDNETSCHVNVNVVIETPGNQPENRLKEIAKAAARQALQDALAAL